MSDLVPAENIERIVGVRRHATEHWGRAVSTEQRVYILHSQQCLDSGIDLRECSFSFALDAGINPEAWVEDTAVPLALVEHDTYGGPWLVPAGSAS